MKSTLILLLVLPLLWSCDEISLTKCDFGIDEIKGVDVEILFETMSSKEFTYSKTSHNRLSIVQNNTYTYKVTDTDIENSIDDGNPILTEVKASCGLDISFVSDKSDKLDYKKRYDYLRGFTYLAQEVDIDDEGNVIPTNIEIMISKFCEKFKHKQITSLKLLAPKCVKKKNDDSKKPKS